ncbi:MAG: UDP-glucose/GDP-mannose dehydrogenase family protein [Bacillota bacterium]
MKSEARLNVTIIGTGYVGLTTGLALAYLGHRVNCVDKNEKIIRKLQAGTPTIYEPGLQELLAESFENVFFSDSLAVSIHTAEIVIIAVGTPAKNNGDTDLSYVEAAAREIGRLMLPDKPLVVVNKSTVPIGSARRVETVILEELEKRGVRGDFSVASNPEFLREGAALHDTFYPDRIVVGSDDLRAANLLRQLYAPILEQAFTPPKAVPRPEGFPLPALVTTRPTSAELIKYAANAFLATKISFINEFARISEKVGADIREVARGIGLDKRIGAGFLQAGVGWGGSCFPKDTQSILFTARQYGQDMPLLNAAVEVNIQQRKKMIEKLQEALKVIRGSTIGILGLSFKANTDDIRESAAIDVIEALLEMGARVKAFDPVAAEQYRLSFPEQEIIYAASVAEAARDADALLLLTDWEEFVRQPWKQIGETMRRQIFIDGRNLLEGGEMCRWGYTYLGIGC